MRAAAAAALLALAGTACVTDTGSDVVVGPPEAQFKEVDAYLVHTCASLDCHGQAGRNLRLYGEYGLRLDPSDETNGNPTTADEIAANYRSVVGLEPEQMTLVVQHHGEHPESLALVAKPEGIEVHKGGQLFTHGSAAYTCITSWLASSVDASSCTAAVRAQP